MYKHILWLRYSDISQLSLGFAVGQPLNLTHLQQTLFLIKITCVATGWLM